MYYGFLNYFLEKKIRRIRPVVSRLLNSDLLKQEELRQRIMRHDRDDILTDLGDVESINKNIDTVVRRLRVEKQYVMLVEQFNDDPKRKYMINYNFHKYLEAIKYLYHTSDINTKAGILTAASEVYSVINGTEKCFTELSEEHET